MNLLVRAFLSWIPVGVAVTGVAMLSYALVQQNYRQSLNDPQIQMAEDAALQMDTYDKTWQDVIPRVHIDMDASLSPWIAYMDASGDPIGLDGECGTVECVYRESTTGFLNGSGLPKVPKGVFDDLASGKVHGAGPKTAFKEGDIAETGENRLTWQPEPGVRQAIVVKQLKNGGFIVAGRNMREVESRISQAGTFTLLAWLIIMTTSLCGSIFNKYVKSEMRKRDGNV